MRGRDVPVSIDFPREPRAPRRRRRLLILVVGLVAILFGFGSAISYWVNLLWFQSLGYGEVFWTTWRLEWEVFAAFAVVTFLVLYGAFSALRRAHQDDLPGDQTILFGGQPVKFSVKPVLGVASVIISLLIAGITGAAMSDSWPTLALWWNAPHTGANPDPIFGKPLNFFLFTLPAWHLILGWLLSLAVICAIAAVFFLMITGAFRALDKGRMTYAASPWRGLSVAVAILLLLYAIDVYLSRFDLLLEHHTIFEGINYTDAHVMLTGLLIVCAALVVGAAIAAVNAFRTPRVKWLVASVVPAALCYGLLGLVGWYVSNFVVKPNELVREEPYIANNIRMTRQAYGLDRFSQREFPAETTVDATDPDNNQATLQNIRLWDWHALQDTLSQVQEIRTYYEFPDIDIDRYNINGTTREVMLATRELNVNKLPDSSRNWINEKLVYTHGYGITMNPVNGFTPEGLPTLILSNMPVQSTVPGLSVSRPEIYFGERTDTDVYVKTKQQEFDYPQGATNSLTSYQGTGGIVLGGFLRRVLLAYDRDDLGKLPFSDDVNAQSRLLMRRNVRDRVAALAPFLTFDQDPYIVLGEDGRLFWMMDAFTTSDSYPYSSHYALGDNSVNYMRNSVKVVIDAYNGTTTFYVFDQQDPILATYRTHLSQLIQGRSYHARGPSQACALSGVVVQATGRSLRPLPHDRTHRCSSTARTFGRSPRRPARTTTAIRPSRRCSRTLF